MLVKRQYVKEIQAPAKTLERGSKGNDVKRVQELLNIWRFYEGSMAVGLTVDGDFGMITLRELKAVQSFLNVKPDGILGPISWQAIVQPIKNAFEFNGFPTSYSLRDRLRIFAEEHNIYRPYEIPPNRGPWVRCYMDGKEGTYWYWCMGFAQAIMDQAFSSLKKKYTDYFVHTYLVEALRQDAKKKELLISHEQIKQGKYQPKPGDIFFLIYSNDSKAHHTGLVVGYFDLWITTVEGNTNFIGGRNGVGVFRRRRNIFQENIDLLSFDNLKL